MGSRSFELGVDEREERVEGERGPGPEAEQHLVVEVEDPPVLAGGGLGDAGDAQEAADAADRAEPAGGHDEHVRSGRDEGLGGERCGRLDGDGRLAAGRDSERVGALVAAQEELGVGAPQVEDRDAGPLGGLPSPLDDLLDLLVDLGRERVGAVGYTEGGADGTGTAGALLQAVFRNPLAEPSVIGVSAGAAVGAVAAIVAGVGSFGGMAVPAAAFVGALAAAGAVYATARRGGRADAVTLVLCGIAVSVIASALTGLLTYAADDAHLRNIVFWSLGSVGGSTWTVVASAVVPIGVVVAAAPLLAGRLDVLTLGEREAGHLGIDVERLRLLVIAMASLATAAAVATAGIVAFVGLVAPHLVRLVVGPGHRALLPLSSLAGAVLVLLSDLAARTVIAPRELPLGVVTALVGGPYLLWLVRRALDDMSGLWS